METITPNTQDIERAITQLLIAIGEDPTREGLEGTPNRIARMYQEIFRGYQEDKKPKITTFLNTKHSEELVFDTGDYYSMCEHHMLPFFGKYYFAYLPNPNGRILGISKVARVVGYCAAKLQLQERLAHEIIDMLDNALKGTAGGFAIMMRGQHMCKSMRGVRNKGEMVVTYYTGAFKKDRQLRNEFLRLVELQKD